MRNLYIALSIILQLTFATASLDAQGRVRIVADLDTEPDASPSGFSETLVSFHGSLFIWGWDPLTGTEVRRISGGTGANVLVKDICPGRCSAEPPRIEAAVLGERFYFTACDPARSCQLWGSDGTAEGTEIVEAFNVDDGLGLFLPARLTAWNGSLYFFADHPVAGVELLTSDGTAAGTSVVKDVRPGRDGVFFGDILPAEDKLFLLAGRELWTSDGTEAGTVLVATHPEGKRFFQEYARVVSDGVLGEVAILPVLGTVVPTELWRSDGTAEGTFKLRDAAGHISDAVSLGDRVAFFETSNEGVDLWSTDGTVGGTFFVGTGFESSRASTAYRGEMYFGSFRALWRSDGTAAGTREVFRFNGSVAGLLVVGDTLFVQVSNDEVWKTEGTAETTERVVGPSVDRYEELIPFGDDRLALEVHRGAGEVELALVDEGAGTLAILTDTVDPGSSDPADLTARPERLLFASGNDVYAVAGVLAPPELVASFPASAEIVPSAGGVFVFGGGLWFLADGSDEPVELRRDRLERRLDADLAVARGRELFFLVRDPDTLTHELHRSDGTPAGTRFAARGLPPLPFCVDFGCRRESVDVALFDSSVLVVHDSVLARADLASGTFETLFDATAVAGCTGLTPDDAVAFCEVGNLTPAVGRVYFTYGGNDVPIVLMTSDGTPEGTRAIRELHPAPPTFGFGETRSPRELTAVRNRLYFVLHDPEHGDELWTSNGTGARLLRDIRPGPWSSFPSSLAAFGGELVFSADDGVTGQELWTSFGTETGTMLVKDLYEGRGGSFPGPFNLISQRLVFSASGEGRGRELWYLQLGEIRLIEDISPGPLPSDPGSLEDFGHLVYMNAADGMHGRELFAFPRALLDDPPIGCRSCLVNDMFDVSVEWVDPNGRRGVGRAVPYDDRNLFFWFFGINNLELLVKVLDGRQENGHHWVFYGALSDVEYTINVENRWTGEVRTYHNPAGNLCGRGDTGAFADHGLGGGGAVPTAPRGPERAFKGTCGPGDGALCLLDGRFRVEVDWAVPGGAAGIGRAVPLTDATGAFRFFGPRNLELTVKVLDGRSVNGRFWVFYGGLSDVEYTITVTDTANGEIKTYRNEAGELCGRGDTGAFGGG